VSAPVFRELPLGRLTLPVRTTGVVGEAALGHLLAPGSVAVLHPFDDTTFYRHGWNSWSPSGWRRLSDAPLRIGGDPDRLQTADDAANDHPHLHAGSAVGALEAPGGEVLLLGALGLGTPRVGADRDTLWGRTEHDGGGWYLGFGPEEEVFAGYASLLAERLGARDGHAGRVWSSWYSFYEDIDEDLVARTVRDLTGHPFDVVQLDDGWERRVGDWAANDRFPSGMAATAGTIRDAGFRPGLWLAPLIALPGSELARQRPDLLVQDDEGRPLATGTNWGGPYHSLDTTRPEALDHVLQAVRDAVQQGWTYLKLDFLYAGAVRGRRARDLPREQVYREAIRAIRDAVGDDVYLLGSGAPMLPSAGILDGVRVGPDVGPFWDNAARPNDPSGTGARNALLAAVHRTWLRPLYELDPDAVYLRSERNLLDPAQRRLLQDVATILGFRSTSDPIGWLRPEEQEALDDFLTAEPRIERIGRYRWRLDGRTADLERVVTETPSEYPVTVLE
jgi:alpha-galactosidase